MVDVPVLAWARWISEKAGVSVVVGDALAEKTLTFDAVNESPGALIQLAARQLGVGVASFGNNYYIGQTSAEDQSLLVRKVYRFDRKDIEEFVKTVCSSAGRVRAFENGVMVVSDTLAAVKRVVEALDNLDRYTGRMWLVQLYIVRSSRELERDISIGADLDVGYRFARRSGYLSADSSLLTTTFDSYLRAKGSSTGANIEQAPLMILEEGATGTVHSGRSVPIPKKTVSDSGTVTTTGFERIKDGLELAITVREGQSGGVLDLVVSQSQITGYVEDAPILTDDRVETRAAVVSGGVYLLAKIATSKQSSTKTGFLAFGASKGDSRQNVEIWGKVYSVSGAVEVAEN